MPCSLMVGPLYPTLVVAPNTTRMLLRDRLTLRSSRPHGVGKEGDNVPTNTGPTVPGSTARLRSGRQEIDTQTSQFLYLGGAIHGSVDLSLEVELRIRLMGACFKRSGLTLYERTTAPFSLREIRMLKAEVVETLLYGCVTWTLSAQLFARLRSAHYQLLVLLRVIGVQRRQRTDHNTIWHAKPVKKRRYESIETTIRKTRDLVRGGRGTTIGGSITQVGDARE